MAGIYAEKKMPDKAETFANSWLPGVLCLQLF